MNDPTDAVDQKDERDQEKHNLDANLGTEHRRKRDDDGNDSDDDEDRSHPTGHACNCSHFLGPGDFNYSISVFVIDLAFRLREARQLSRVSHFVGRCLEITGEIV